MRLKQKKVNILFEFWSLELYTKNIKQCIETSSLAMKSFPLRNVLLRLKRISSFPPQLTDNRKYI